MPSKDTIIFVLNTELELYQFESDTFKCTLIDGIKQETRLELYSSFESFWNKNWDSLKNLLQLSSEKVKPIYFIIGPQAGFTNTRIVFLWLKSLVEFYDSRLSMNFIKIPEYLDLEKLSSNDIKNLLNTSVSTLDYAMEPRIGVK